MGIISKLRKIKFTNYFVDDEIIIITGDHLGNMRGGLPILAKRGIRREMGCGQKSPLGRKVDMEGLVPDTVSSGSIELAVLLLD